MAERMALHRELKTIYNHVYFQPPGHEKITYPCIIYKRSAGNAKYADNKVYTFRQQYEVTAITKDPDDQIVETMMHKFPLIQHNRHFQADNLNHEVFLLYW
jgi:hypothetical protein